LQEEEWGFAFIDEKREEVVMNNRILFPLHYLIGFLLLLGCSVESKDTHKNIKGLENSIKDIQSQINALRLRALYLEISQKSNMIANIDPSEKGYQRINTSSGFFLISCVDAKPFPGGL
jgi:hypothetical protein